MKMRIASKCLAFALAAGFGLMLAGQATAQTFRTVYNFSNESEGAGPQGGLVLSGDTLYGTTGGGGNSGDGTVFAVNTDGTAFTNLHSFTEASTNDAGLRTNSDGISPSPWGGVLLSGTMLYGTAARGGTSGDGTVFAVNTDGTGFTNLYSFADGSDGAFPEAGLVLSGDTLYGTALGGGSSDKGTVFAVNTDGAGFTTLYSFTGGSDGARPYARLLLSGNTLYGTAESGGSSGYGAVFAINTDGTGFTNLYGFTDGTDGGSPWAGLVLLGNTLYGTTWGGGSSDLGTVFAINTDGTGFNTLHSFTAFIEGTFINSDGASPQAGLVLSGNALYGTTGAGGTGEYGTVFAVNTDGTGFTTLYNIADDSGGERAGLISSGSTLYGTTAAGGSSGYGTVFSLSLAPVSAPQLSITLSGTNVVLTWPTNAIGFTLQSTANLGSSAVWTPVSPAPVVINGQNTVTNPISGTEQFYQLSQ